MAFDCCAAGILGMALLRKQPGRLKLRAGKDAGVEERPCSVRWIGIIRVLDSRQKSEQLLQDDCGTLPISDEMMMHHKVPCALTTGWVSIETKCAGLISTPSCELSVFYITTLFYCTYEASPR